MFSRRPQQRDWESKPMTAEAAGLKRFPPNQKVVLTVDDYSSDPVNDYRGRCDGEPDRYPGDPFDYHHDQQLYAHQQSLEILAFISKQIVTMPPNQNRFSKSVVNKYLDTELNYHILLEDRFGPLDRNSEQYKIMYENIKISVIEEYKMWVEDSNEILKAFPFPSTSRSEQVAEIFKILFTPYWGAMPDAFMTANDPRVKQSANVFKSHMEPYKVPRPDPKELIRKELLFQNHKDKNEVQPSSFSSQAVAVDLINGQLNLAYFEPSLRTPSLMNSFHEFYSKNRILHNIVDILLRYPLGACSDFLWKKYQEEFQLDTDKLDLPKLESLGYSNFAQFLGIRDDFFKVCIGESNFLNLVFPACRENVVGVNILLKRLHHMILLMFKFLDEEQAQRDHNDTANAKPETSTTIKIQLEDVTNMLQNIFGIRLTLEQWGFGNNINNNNCTSKNKNKSNSVLAFYKSLLHSHDAGFLEIYSEENGKSLTHFLKLINPIGSSKNTMKRTTLEILEEEFGYEMADLGAVEGMQLSPNTKMGFTPTHPPITDFLPTKIKILAVADSIQKGKAYFAQANFMISPLHFNVSLLQCMDSTNAFVLTMTSQYNKWMKVESFATQVGVSLDDLENNKSYVAVFFEDEWVRGKVVAGNIVMGIFKLFLIDLGFYVERVALKDMKKLHKSFVDYPAQIFSCRLKLVEMDTFYNITEESNRECFPNEVLKVFYDTLNLQVMGIILLKRVNNPVDWEVKVFMIDSPAKGNVIVPDLLKYLISLDLSAAEQEELEKKWGDAAIKKASEKNARRKANGDLAEASTSKTVAVPPTSSIN